MSASVATRDDRHVLVLDTNVWIDAARNDEAWDALQTFLEHREHRVRILSVVA